MNDQVVLSRQLSHWFQMHPKLIAAKITTLKIYQTIRNKRETGRWMKGKNLGLELKIFL